MAGFLAPARLTGVAEADLRVNEPLVAGVPARVRGSIAVKGLGVADARHELLGAQRVEATGLQLEWPARFSVKRLLVSNSRGTIERDRGRASAHGTGLDYLRCPSDPRARSVR
jgi:hypothetical protein